MTTASVTIQWLMLADVAGQSETQDSVGMGSNLAARCVYFVLICLPRAISKVEELF